MTETISNGRFMEESIDDGKGDIMSNGETISDTRIHVDAQVMVPVTLHVADKSSVVAEDTELKNSLVLNSRARVPENGSRVSTCRAELQEQNKVLAGSIAPVTDFRNIFAEEDTDERLPMKYIFQRKSKKSPFSIRNENVTNGAGKKHIVASDAKESNQMVDSSQDSQLAAQVARQLISSSEKKWWR